jgi:hypothetical protein
MHARRATAAGTQNKTLLCKAANLVMLYYFAPA